MTGFLKIVLFFIFFLLIIRFVRLISRYWSTSKKTIDDLKDQQREESKQFDDVEDAEYREISSEDKKESNDNEV